MQPLKLTAAEQTDLVVFLESVSTLSNPWRPEDLTRCQLAAVKVQVFWTTMLGNLEVMSRCDSAILTAQRRAMLR